MSEDQKPKVPVLKYLASRYTNQTLAELVRRLNPVYAAKRPAQNYLHYRHCSYCTEEIVVFKYTFAVGESPGTVGLNQQTGQMYFKCSDYQACKQRKLDLQG